MSKDIYKGVVLGAVVSTLVLVTATAMAGTGVGAVFNLGKTNAVNATTTLKGSTSGRILQVTNGGAGPALGLKVMAGKPPMTVSSSAKVTRLNADLLDGLDSGAFVRNGGLGAIAAHGRWYAPALPSSPTYVKPNRFGGEGGTSSNGGSLQMTKLATGWYRLKVEPALSGSEFTAFVNADSWGPTPLYAQGSGPFAGPVWDVFVHNKDGVRADAYYISVMLVPLY